MTRDFRFLALKHIADINAGGLAARMPYGELVQAADELAAEGLAEWRDERKSSGRWLTSAGQTELQALLAREPTP